MCHNISMTDGKIKQMIKETLEPMFDELVELNFKIISGITKNLPADMPEDQQLDLIKSILKSHNDILVASIKSSVPADFDTKLKEAYNGRRS